MFGWSDEEQIKLDLIRHGDKLGDLNFRSSQGKDKFG